MKLINIQEPSETVQAQNSGVAVGIDLGTTNSLVSIMRNGKAEIIPDENGNLLLPSIVSYLDNNDVIVGKSVGEHSVSSVKRLMGRSAEKISIANHTFTPVEISSNILMTLKKRAENYIGQDVTEAVITVPAYFDDTARTATKDAAKLAGLKVLRLINEPTAAALAYGLDSDAEGIYAIYDLGGGTFDISILKMSVGVFQVLATSGDISIGGDDFDDEIAKELLKQAPDIKNIRDIAVEAKEHLTYRDNWNHKTELRSLKLNINDFNKLIESYVDKTIDICKSALIDAKVNRSDINGVVLVGGSTRIPFIRQKIENFFEQSPLTDVDPDKVVATGAAIQAHALTVGAAHLLLDVTPLSIGLETMGDVVEKIIHRNTPIPTSHSQKFTTYMDNQNGMKIHVLQGEREMVADCRSLAKFELLGIPPMPAGGAIVNVTFTIDADGLLTVSAKEENTGIQQEIEVNPSYGIKPDEIVEMLRDSMIYAKSDITQRLLAESKTDAKRMIQAIDSALQTDGDLLNNDVHKNILKQIELLKNLLNQDDREAIDIETQRLDKISSSFAQKRMNSSLKQFVTGKVVSSLEKKINN